MGTAIPAFGPRAGFWVAAAVVANTLWTSAAPAMTYRLYAADWGLSTTVTTAIYAVFPIVVVAALVGLGDLSDHIGRRAAILLGLAASFVGTLLFALAPDIAWVFAGRAFQGLGVGLAAGPATAAMVEFAAGGQSQRTSAVTTAAQAVGLTGATIVGGGLIEYVPFPTHLNYWVLSAAIALLFAAAWFLPRHRRDGIREAWRPRLPAIPPALRRPFTAASLAATTGFALGAMMLSLGGQVAHDVIGSPNALVNGAAIALFPIVAGIVGILARRLPSTTAIVFGGVATTTGMALLALSAAQHSLAIFLVAALAGGSGYSLLFTGGLGLLSARAPAAQRGATLSALYLVAYLMQGVIALLLGMVATRWGLAPAIELGAGIIAVMSMVAVGLANALDRRPAYAAARHSPILK